MDEEVTEQDIRETVYVCECFEKRVNSEEKVISERKQKILNIVERTESYLRSRRMPELVRFLITKLLANEPKQPMEYLEKLLDECMFFRAGHGLAPVLFNNEHLLAIVKSFDPGQRGWMSTGQVCRAFNTVGLTLEEFPNERVPTVEVLDKLQKTQEEKLFSLLTAGMKGDVEERESDSFDTL